MDDCCRDKAGELAELRTRQSRVLYVVLAINAAMFVIEFASGWIAASTALLGDSLDMLGDASVYAVTLYALTASARTRAGIALSKGLAMLAFGLVVVAEAGRKAWIGAAPDAGLMALVGSAALVANAVCFALLYRHRADDLNMQSTWLCSRNDLIANAAVLAAAGLVVLSGSRWPDVLVGVAIALLFLHSARQVLVQAWSEWRISGGEGRRRAGALH